ncbi:MAG: protein NirF [Leptospiraceae bacterium]|nr:MAG: protein NirF [Leptospiraceae bacterium]
MRYINFLLFLFITSLLTLCTPRDIRVGSFIYVVERENSTLAVIDIENYQVVKRIPLEANLRHATIVFEPSLKYGYIATRNGKLNRINLETKEYDGYIETSKNSIGLAISQDGQTIAVSEYEPGGITIVSVKDFKIKQVIPAKIGNNKYSKVTGLVDGPENSFICALMDSNEIWILKRENPVDPESPYKITHKIKTADLYPFDGLITPDGRYYVNAHFKSNILSFIDLWNLKDRAEKIDFGKYSKKTPVKMPHMEAWANADEKIFIAANGEPLLHVINAKTLKYSHSIPIIGDGVYTVVHPFQKEIWITFSGESDGKIQIIDTRTEKTIKILDVGKKIYHLAFTPKGDRAFVSSNATNELIVIRTYDYKIIKRIPLNSPSGIFGVWRAYQIGL